MKSLLETGTIVKEVSTLIVICSMIFGTRKLMIKVRNSTDIGNWQVLAVEMMVEEMMIHLEVPPTMMVIHIVPTVSKAILNHHSLAT